MPTAFHAMSWDGVSCAGRSIDRTWMRGRIDPSASSGRPCDIHAAMSDTGTAAPIRTRAMHGLRLAVVEERDGPLPAMLVALTVLAGIVDATSILKLGHVFVATMTGNLVFVGLAIAGAKGFAIVPCLLSIGG